MEINNVKIKLTKLNHIYNAWITYYERSRFNGINRYWPDEIMEKVEEGLLTRCLEIEEEEIDMDELVLWAIRVIDDEIDPSLLW